MGPAPSQVQSIPLHDAALLPAQQWMIPRDPCQEHTHTWPCGPILCDTGPCVSDVHREFMPRTLSSYMPEEIWRKAGEWG